MKHLTLDIGNTRTKAAVFTADVPSGGVTSGRPVTIGNWPTGDLEAAAQWIGNRSFDACIFSSVAAPDAAFSGFLRKKAKNTLELTHETPLPFKNAYATPRTLGKDRLASVAGAHVLFPKEAVLIVDCGTCIKYELLSAEGVYLGGNIAPGMQMRLDAMAHFTARLPRPAAQFPDMPYGTSTETALQNGAVCAAAVEIEGFVRLFRKKYGKMRLVMTGGDAAFLMPHIAIRQKKAVPELVLLGLEHILLFNIQK